MPSGTDFPPLLASTAFYARRSSFSEGRYNIEEPAATEINSLTTRESERERQSVDPRGKLPTLGCVRHVAAARPVSPMIERSDGKWLDRCCALRILRDEKRHFRRVVNSDLRFELEKFQRATRDERERESRLTRREEMVEFYFDPVRRSRVILFFCSSSNE